MSDQGDRQDQHRRFDLQRELERLRRQRERERREDRRRQQERQRQQAVLNAPGLVRPRALSPLREGRVEPGREPPAPRLRPQPILPRGETPHLLRLTDEQSDAIARRHRMQRGARALRERLARAIEEEESTPAVGTTSSHPPAPAVGTTSSHPPAPAPAPPAPPAPARARPVPGEPAPALLPNEPAMTPTGGPFGKDTQDWLKFVIKYLKEDDHKKEGSGYSSRDNIRNRLINDRLNQIKMRRLQESQMSAVEMEGGVLTDQQFRQAQQIAQQLQVRIEILRERINQEWDRPDEELNQDLINRLSIMLEDHERMLSPILRAIREYEDMFHPMDTSEE